jgi:M6 family metalloprotease-like protein
LIILASFADRTFAEAHTTELYQRMANEEGFVHELGFKGSVHDYFKDQSGGRFLLDFDVVGPVKLSLNYAYYGENDIYGQDMRAGEMVAEACKLAAKDVDYADYDWDGDGVVEQVVVLFAGQGEHCCEDAMTIWPHESELSYSDYGHTLKLDGMVISTYACCSELSVKGRIEGIGTLCHEFSHCLGLPDMYDTEENNCFGMSRWDLMDYGCYNDNGFTPCGYTSYERMLCGWLQPVVLTSPCEETEMQPLSMNGIAYLIYNTKAPQEYYLLENRQQVGWDRSLPGSGLLILHVDEDEEVWLENRVNTDPAHQHCTIFHADIDSGTTISDLQGDPYPCSNNDSLTRASLPAATLYHQSAEGDYYMPVAITQIRQQDDRTVSFHFRPTGQGKIDPPQPDGSVFYESFNKNRGKGGNDGKWGGSIALAQFEPDHERWESAKSYGANQCAKFGTTSAYGMAVTPPIYLNGDYELSFLAAPWNNEENFIWLDVESGMATLGNHVFDVMQCKQWNEHQTALTGHGWVKLLFYSNQHRFFLDEVVIRRVGAITTHIPSPSVEVISPLFTPLGTLIKHPLPKGIYIQNGRKVMR